MFTLGFLESPEFTDGEHDGGLVDNADPFDVGTMGQLTAAAFPPTASGELDDRTEAISFAFVTALLFFGLEGLLVVVFPLASVNAEVGAELGSGKLEDFFFRRFHRCH